MDLETEVQNQLLIARILEEELSLRASTLKAAQIQLDEVLIGSEPGPINKINALKSTTVSTPQPIDDAEFALSLFSGDVRLTSDAAYVESLQVSEESMFSESWMYALSVAAAENKLQLDMAFAKKLQDDEDAGRGAEGVVGDIEKCVPLLGAIFCIILCTCAQECWVARRCPR
jgi:hypothetical protein